MTAADARAVFDAGRTERALHDAVLTTSLFYFMNRLVDGHGCTGSEEIFKGRGRAPDVPRVHRRAIRDACGAYIGFVGPAQ